MHAPGITLIKISCFRLPQMNLSLKSSEIHINNCQRELIIRTLLQMLDLMHKHNNKGVGKNMTNWILLLLLLLL
jgi:hypothetical protein